MNPVGMLCLQEMALAQQIASLTMHMNSERKSGALLRNRCGKASPTPQLLLLKSEWKQGSARSATCSRYRS